MARNNVTITWLLPFIALAPIGLAHCIGPTERDDSSEMAGPAADSGQMKVPADDGGQKSGGDSGTKTQGDASSTKQPPDSGAPTGGDDGGSAASPDAGHTPGSVTCNGAPCDVSQGNVCCVTWTPQGVKEACNPPHTTCFGHTLECDDEDDCSSGVCCQQFPSGGLPGSASCQGSCSAHICR
jgi:hypothetical protein